MDNATLLALTGFAFAASWTPGPNNVMLTASGATFGWRATQPHAFGVALGFPVMVFLVALGLGEVFQRNPEIKTVLAWVGMVVMLYLAWRIGMAGRAKGMARSRPLSFFEGSAFQWVNPKAWVMAVGTAATYASGAEPVREAAVAAGVFVVAAISSTQAWALFGAGIGRLLGDGWRLRAFNGAMGVLLAVSALWLVLGE